MELEYFAGFFDGEGWVGTHRSTPRCIEVVCNVANTVKDPIELFQARFGGSIRLRRYAPGINSKPLWMWEIKNRHAEAFLRAIEPFTIVKKGKIAMALELLSLIPRRGQYRKTHYDRLTEEQRAEREATFQRRFALADAIKAANKRGIN